MNSHVELLIRIIGQPVTPPVKKDWTAVFEALGMWLPDDYIELVRVFGATAVYRLAIYEYWQSLHQLLWEMHREANRR
ncbi:hypothetical protein [Streptomyces sp. ERV7]|uniref:hypothetical protein n=1 Tax=Streptomyces sp. ERV7 TaxID=1322334 RepID=UPI001F3E5250|nr:hypothetical protein [Streptomyces sp. ERV7]